MCFCRNGLWRTELMDGRSRGLTWKTSEARSARRSTSSTVQTAKDASSLLQSNVKYHWRNFNPKGRISPGWKHRCECVSWLKRWFPSFSFLVTYFPAVKPEWDFLQSFSILSPKRRILFGRWTMAAGPAAIISWLQLVHQTVGARLGASLPVISPTAAQTASVLLTGHPWSCHQDPNRIKPLWSHHSHPWIITTAAEFCSYTIFVTFTLFVRGGAGTSQGGEPPMQQPSKDFSFSYVNFLPNDLFLNQLCPPSFWKIAHCLQLSATLQWCHFDCHHFFDPKWDQTKRFSSAFWITVVLIDAFSSFQVLWSKWLQFSPNPSFFLVVFVGASQLGPPPQSFWFSPSF